MLGEFRDVFVMYAAPKQVVTRTYRSGWPLHNWYREYMDSRSSKNNWSRLHMDAYSPL